MYEIYCTNIHNEWEFLTKTDSFNLAFAFSERGYKVVRSES